MAQEAVAMMIDAHDLTHDANIPLVDGRFLRIARRRLAEEVGKSRQQVLAIQHNHRHGRALRGGGAVGITRWSAHP